MSTKDLNSFPPELRNVVANNHSPVSPRPNSGLFVSQPYQLSEPLDYRNERIRGFAMSQLRAYDVDSFLAAVIADDLHDVVQSNERLQLDRAWYQFKDPESAKRMGELIKDCLMAKGSKARVVLEAFAP